MKKIATVLLLAALSGCGGSHLAQDASEIGQAAADALASLDETGTGSGFAWKAAPIDRPGLDRTLLDRALDLALPPAHAAACWAEQFSACAAGARTKTFNDCTIGLSKLAGSVSLTFSDQACALSTPGATVTRNANFTLTGPRNGTLTVSSAGGGQKVTKTVGGFTYAVLGMNRTGTAPSGDKLFDISTRTTQDLVVQGGSTRLNRTIESGTLQIEHHLAKYTTTLTAENVKWGLTCNCPTSGKLTGTTRGLAGGDVSASVEFTGCGTGTVTIGTTTESVTFDRCSGI